MGNYSKIPINGVQALLETDIKIITVDNNVMLKTGYTEFDTDLYPDATTAPIGSVNIEDTFYSTSNEDDPRGIAVDDNYIYIVGNDSSRMRLHDVNSPYDYLGYISPLPVTSEDIAVDNNYFYIVEQNVDTITIYNKSSPYAEVDSFEVNNGESNNVKGIAVDDDYIYVTGYDTDKVFLFNKIGHTLYDSFDVGNSEGKPTSVSVDDNFIYVVGQDQDRVWIYDKVAPYTNKGNFASIPRDSEGIDIFNGLIYVVGSYYRTVAIYSNNSGIGLSEKIDSVTGLPIYIRIK